MEKQCLLKMLFTKARAVVCQVCKGRTFPPYPGLREAPDQAGLRT